MKNTIAGFARQLVCGALGIILGLMPVTAYGQDRLKTMPGYDQYQKMASQIPGSVKPGTMQVKWLDGGKAFEFRRDGKNYRYDVATRTAAEAEPSPAAARASPRC